VALACAAVGPWLGSFAPAAAQPAAEALEVRFELNDAQVKDRRLPGVSVRVLRPGAADAFASGVTGADGRFTARLAPGTYQVSYSLAGYVPYTSGATEIAGDSQLVTVSLSRMLEETEAAARDVRIVLNWGSGSEQVKDADSHLACGCGASDRHVYFRSRSHKGAGHAAELDVDDTDWGGPETVTLTRPAAGAHVYWVHDYSGPPARFGTSELVVRVLVGSRQVGEFRVPKGLTRRLWRPFKAIEASGAGAPVLLRWSEDEIAEGRDLVLPPGLEQPDPPQAPRALRFACPLFAAFVVLALVVRRRRLMRSA
jgi:hypothetical protein